MLRKLFGRRKVVGEQKELGRLRCIVAALTDEIDRSLCSAAAPFMVFFEQHYTGAIQKCHLETVAGGGLELPYLTVLDRLTVRMKLKLSEDRVVEELQRLSAERNVTLGLVKRADKRGYFSFTLHKCADETLLDLMEEAFKLLNRYDLTGNR
jgi:hypothetical protein